MQTENKATLDLLRAEFDLLKKRIDQLEQKERKEKERKEKEDVESDSGSDNESESESDNESDSGSDSESDGGDIWTCDCEAENDWNGTHICETEDCGKWCCYSCSELHTRVDICRKCDDWICRECGYVIEDGANIKECECGAKKPRKKTIAKRS